MRLHVVTDRTSDWHFQPQSWPCPADIRCESAHNQRRLLPPSLIPSLICCGHKAVQPGGAASSCCSLLLLQAAAGLCCTTCCIAAVCCCCLLTLLLVRDMHLQGVDRQCTTSSAFNQTAAASFRNMAAAPRQPIVKFSMKATNGSPRWPRAQAVSTAAWCQGHSQQY